MPKTPKKFKRVMKFFRKNNLVDLFIVKILLVLLIVSTLLYEEIVIEVIKEFNGTCLIKIYKWLVLICSALIFGIKCIRLTLDESAKDLINIIKIVKKIVKIIFDKIK